MPSTRSSRKTSTKSHSAGVEGAPIPSTSTSSSTPHANARQSEPESDEPAVKASRRASRGRRGRNTRGVKATATAQGQGESDTSRRGSPTQAPLDSHQENPIGAAAPSDTNMEKENAESGFKEPSGGYFEFEPSSDSTEGGGSRLSPGKQTLEHLVARNEEASRTHVQRLNIRRATRTPGQATTDDSQSTSTDDRVSDRSTVSGLGTTPSY
ncbi:uncharacterized protein JCM15063_001981 [Sporobolomyces koalae]|uniref:uncharacterized protein n=1 Tax=Sporobolomyces koalae TaxID=500713 RepID=UPI003170DB08